MYRIDYSKITAQSSPDRQMEVAQDEFDKCGDYVCLTDALSERENGGLLILKMLDDADQNRYRHSRLTFRLKPLKDEWGNEIKPGDKIRRRIIPLFRQPRGKKYRNNEILNMKRTGKFEKELENMNLKREFEVKSDGTIDCFYQDAIYFLSEFGVHFETGYPISGRREMSSGPCKHPDGGMRHVHYWRFQEAPPSEEPQKETKGKKR